VLFTTLALVGSVALAEPTVLAAPIIPENTTVVPCGTTMTYDEFLAAEAYFEVNSRPAPRPDTAAVTLNLIFHIISRDNTVFGGQIPDYVLSQQMSVLNQDFFNTGLSWRISGVRRLIRPDWYSLTPDGPSYRQMKQELYVGGAPDLNVYTVGSFTDRAYGYATFPSQYRNAPRQDGIVIVADTFPGGTIQGNNLGRILTHEAGHWVGLFHTFENYGSFPNGCLGPGDVVDDTPAEAVPARGCPVGLDTCSSPGLDPIFNHMDYTSDYCRSQFTPGQIARLRQQIRTFRGIP